MLEEPRKLFNFDHWYNVTLFLGLLSIAVPFFFPNTVIVNPKHILGMGIGLVLLSIGFIKANRFLSRRDGGHLIQWRETIHDPVSKILTLIGGILLIIFMGLLIYSLI